MRFEIGLEATIFLTVVVVVVLIVLDWRINQKIRRESIERADEIIQAALTGKHPERERLYLWLLEQEKINQNVQRLPWYTGDRYADIHRALQPFYQQVRWSEKLEELNSLVDTWKNASDFWDRLVAGMQLHRHFSYNWKDHWEHDNINRLQELCGYTENELETELLKLCAGECERVAKQVERGESTFGQLETVRRDIAEKLSGTSLKARFLQTRPENWNDLLVLHIQAPHYYQFFNPPEIADQEIRITAKQALVNEDIFLIKLILSLCSQRPNVRELVGEIRINQLTDRVVAFHQEQAKAGEKP